MGLLFAKMKCKCTPIQSDVKPPENYCFDKKSFAVVTGDAKQPATFE
jgi:hypothetical protein